MAWWDGVEPCKQGLFDYGVSKKHDFNGTLHLTQRAGLKDAKGDKFGLYYKEMLGRRVWIPLAAMTDLTLEQGVVDARPGVGLIGFGAEGIAGAVAVNALTRKKAYKVSVIQALTADKKTHHFFTKSNEDRVRQAFGPLLDRALAAKRAAVEQKMEAARRQKEAAQAELERIRNEQAVAAELERQRHIQEQAAAIASAVQSPISVADELAKLAQLRDAGVLTDEEFAQQKTALLSRGAS